MIYIDGLGFIEDKTAYKSSGTKHSDGRDFDTILEQETIIYAQPESNGTSNGASSQAVNSPASLEGYFQQASNTYGVDINLLKAVAKQESGFKANAVSSAGAMGIMQLMPGTASAMGVSDPYDAQQNIMGGAKYLSQMLKKYNGNVALALAAYNAGSGNVDKYGGIPPFSETQNYVKKVLAYMGDNLAGNNTIYAVADTSVKNNQADSDATTIYAIAASDATSPARIYTVSATPATRV